MQLLRPEEMEAVTVTSGEETEETDFRMGDSAAAEITSGTVIGSVTTGTDSRIVTMVTG